MKKNIKRIGLAILGILAAAVITFAVWANLVYRAEPSQLAIASDEARNNFHIAEKPDYWEIIPNNASADSIKYQNSALIFYPGAKVEPQAYFYKLSGLANGEAGKMAVFVTKPTLNLAVFSINQADRVIQDHPEVKKWIVGGHSLGGAMSCEYAKNHKEKVGELWLFAAYCGSDISETNLKVVLIHGSLDGVLNMQKLTENRQYLPATISDFEIQGINHAQIGNYGPQSGDNVFTKSDEDARNEMMKIFRELLSVT